MKQKYTLFVLLSLIVFGCTNQELEYVDAGQVQVKADFIKSRVSFNESGDKTYAYWETGDAITLSTPTQGNLNYTATVSEGDATVATFGSEAGSLKDIDGETVYACYPAATITDGVVALPATDTWTDAKPLPFAYAVSSIAESKVDLAFEHVFAFLKLTLPASALENATSTDGDKSVHRILVKSASEDLGILSGTFNFEDKSVNVTESSKEVVLALGTAFNPSEETGRSVYIPILPQSGDVAITISLKHAYDGGEDVLLELEKQTPASGFVAGHVYTLTFNGNDSDIEDGGEVTIYIPGVITEDGYNAALWVDGEARFVGSSIEEGFQTYPILSSPSVLNSFYIDGDDIYMSGHENSAPGTMEYYERGTIWKNGTIIFQEEQTNSVIRDICVSGSDIYAVGDLNGVSMLWNNGESVLLPKKGSPSSSWANAVSVQNGNVYIMGYEFNGSDATSKTVFWKNGELMDIELDGKGLCMSMIGDDIYCLFEKNWKTYFYKNGDIVDTGLETVTGISGPHYQTLFVDGEDVYIVGQQNGIAKIWKNGVISLLTTEENVCALTGIYVYNKDVYVVGYDFAYDENNNQSTVMKLWKNGEESIVDTSSWSHAYPFGVFVTPK